MENPTKSQDEIPVIVRHTKFFLSMWEVFNTFLFNKVPNLNTFKSILMSKDCSLSLMNGTRSIQSK